MIRMWLPTRSNRFGPEKRKSQSVGMDRSIDEKNVKHVGCEVHLSFRPRRECQTSNNCINGLPCGNSTLLLKMPVYSAFSLKTNLIFLSYGRIWDSWGRTFWDCVSFCCCQVGLPATSNPPASRANVATLELVHPLEETVHFQFSHNDIKLEAWKILGKSTDRWRAGPIMHTYVHLKKLQKPCTTQPEKEHIVLILVFLLFCWLRTFHPLPASILPPWGKSQFWTARGYRVPKGDKGSKGSWLWSMFGRKFVTFWNVILVSPKVDHFQSGESFGILGWWRRTPN